MRTSSTVRILRTKKEVNCQSNMEGEQAAKDKKMEDEQRNFSQMMDPPYPTIPPETQMPLGQSSGQEQDLEGSSMDPFRIEKLNEGLSLQSNAIKLQQRHDSLEQRLKAVENQNTLKGLNPNDLNLVFDLVIPPHFKMPRFEKYDETSCPEMHLIMYYNKMTVHAHNEKLLIHIFQESLTGATSKWYLRLKRNQACTWKNLSRAFLEQYKYMLDIAPDRFTLQGMKRS